MSKPKFLGSAKAHVVVARVRRRVVVQIERACVGPVAPVAPTDGRIAGQEREPPRIALSRLSLTFDKSTDKPAKLYGYPNSVLE